MMGNMEQEQYYIATEDGKTEGPYSFESLEASYTEGKITQKTLVCIAGGQEWVQFGTVLEQKWKEESKKSTLERLMNEYDPIAKKQPAERPHEQSESLEITVEGLFRFFGVIALLAGVIVFMYHAQEQTGIGLAYLLAGAFSCLGCFWCAKVIKLLSYSNRLLLVIAKNTRNSIDKQ